MATIRYKGTVVGSAQQTEGIAAPPAPTLIVIKGSPAFAPSPGTAHTFLTNVANAISNLAINGAASIYITTNATDVAAIEGAVTIIAASNQD
jgi:hypothetical protein